MLLMRTMSHLKVRLPLQYTLWGMRILVGQSLCHFVLSALLWRYHCWVLTCLMWWNKTNQKSWTVTMTIQTKKAALRVNSIQTDIPSGQYGGIRSCLTLSSCWNNLPVAGEWLTCGSECTSYQALPWKHTPDWLRQRTDIQKQEDISGDSENHLDGGANPGSG